MSLKNIDMQTAKQPKLRSLLIEAVNNGFIVYENEKHGIYNSPEASVSERLVFNTKQQLNDYINENF